MKFYDIHEQTKYQVTVSSPESVEELSDLFITEEELQDLVGRNCYIGGSGERTFILKNVATVELEKWADKLDASGKKTLVIDDPELLDLLKTNSYVSDFISNKYGRHGDRICYSQRYKRKKTKPTKADVRQIWNTFQWAFRDKFGCYPSHIPLYDRHLSMFKAYQKILGWKRVSKQLRNSYDSTYMKFFKQIWDNPEEYV